MYKDNISDLCTMMCSTMVICFFPGGLSLPQLRRMYFEMKDTVFKQQSKFISHTCDTNALEELLKRMLGTDQRMDEIKKPK